MTYSSSALVVLRFVVASTLVTLGLPAAASAQQADTTWDVTLARGQTREIDSTTSEGTWMSVDISPDGRWIVFDLLTHQQRWLAWRQLLPHTRRRALRPVTDYSFALVAQSVADIIAEGGYGAVGSHDQHHGLSPH